MLRHITEGRAAALGRTTGHGVRNLPLHPLAEASAQAHARTSAAAISASVLAHMRAQMASDDFVIFEGAAGHQLFTYAVATKSLTWKVPSARAGATNIGRKSTPTELEIRSLTERR